MSYPRWISSPSTGTSVRIFTWREQMKGILLLLQPTEFNLDYYTEVQDLSYLENTLNSVSPRFQALNMAICSLIEDFSLVGFETLAVEVCTSSWPGLGVV